MAWIESHTVIIRHRKLISLSRDLRLKPVYVLGHLHALWHAALEQQEDGDLSSWSDDLIAEFSHYQGDAPQYVSLLQRHGWLDGRMIHDWTDYAGRYLEAKYRTSDPEWLKIIKEKHSHTLVRLKTDFSLTKVSPPNPPNPPNLPNPKNSFSSDSVEFGLSELLFGLIRGRNPTCKTPNMQAWARNIDLMIRIDHRDPNEIRELIQLCQKDDFWQNNILSTEKLRKQYDQLKLKLMLLRGQVAPGRRIPPECNGCKKEECKGCEHEGKWV